MRLLNQASRGLLHVLSFLVQVRFGVLNAGNFGVSQSRKRTFIWAAAPGETLPDWPEPLTVFASPQLCINLPGGISYKAVKDGRNARLRAVTVQDAIKDLPPVENGADEYAPQPQPFALIYGFVFSRHLFTSSRSNFGNHFWPYSFQREVAILFTKYFCSGQSGTQREAVR